MLDRLQTPSLAQPRLSPPLLAAASIQIFVVVAASTYWALWYGGGRGLLTEETSAAYIAFQDAFLLADGWLVLTCVLGALAILRRSPSWRSWVLLGASASIFLGLMDVCFDLENGVYRSAGGGGAMLELSLNSMALGFGGYGVWLGRLGEVRS
ncbi:MAG: hypothetical protein U1E65_03285 [Myxococcota bacterium]